MELLNMFLGPLGATFLLGITTFVLLLWHSSRKHQYWKKRNVPFVKPHPIFGSMLKDMLSPQHELDVVRNKELGLIWGHYEMNLAALSVSDPQLIKDITVKDFNIFPNRRIFLTADTMADSMVTNLVGEDWKRVRTIITPAFTTGKLKRMIGIFEECSMTLVQNFKKSAEKGEFIDVKKVFGALAMDVIASTSFSTKIDSHNDPENKFVRMSRKVFEQTFTWRVALYLMFPAVARFFKVSLFEPESITFFKTITAQIIKERRKHNQTRNDFLQLLIDTSDEVAKENKWELNETDGDLTNNYGSEVTASKVYGNSVSKNLSMDELIAQCIIFFIAGYETTGSTLAFATYCLAVNTEIQENARQSINDVLKETNGEVTYEALQKMKYIDNIISEAMRLYPPATRLERKAEADYKLGNTGITIEKETLVTFPVYAMHRDPKYWLNPEQFDPDRFNPEERAKRNPYAYMPFGAGPRNCIGMRFALLEIKICLVYILSHFDIQPCSKTEIPLKFHPQLNMLRPHDIYLKMEPRSDSFIKS